MNIPGIVLHPSAQEKLAAFVTAPSHAVLLSGSAGTGKTIVASTIAATLLGIAPDKLPTYPYYQVIQPDKGTIKIEQIRHLLEFFRLKVPGRKQIQRVAIVQDADAMGHEAQNALLKMLEEPPTDSVLLLTSSKPQALLATIRSRTTIVALPNAESQALQSHFEQVGHKPATVAQALLRQGTNIAEVSRLLAGETSTSGDSLALVKQVLAGSSYDRMLLVDSLSKKKDEAAAFIHDLASVATASIEVTARKGSSVSRWQNVLQASTIADDALAKNGNAKLVLSELMLSL